MLSDCGVASIEITGGVFASLPETVDSLVSSSDNVSEYAEGERHRRRVGIHKKPYGKGGELKKYTE